jgi:hypothetical protein
MRQTCLDFNLAPCVSNVQLGHQRVPLEAKATFNAFLKCVQMLGVLTGSDHGISKSRWSSITTSMVFRGMPLQSWHSQKYRVDCLTVQAFLLRVTREILLQDAGRWLPICAAACHLFGIMVGCVEPAHLLALRAYVRSNRRYSTLPALNWERLELQELCFCVGSLTLQTIADYYKPYGEELAHAKECLRNLDVRSHISCPCIRGVTLQTLEDNHNAITKKLAPTKERLHNQLVRGSEQLVREHELYPCARSLTLQTLEDWGNASREKLAHAKERLRNLDVRDGKQRLLDNEHHFRDLEQLVREVEQLVHDGKQHLCDDEQRLRKIKQLLREIEQLLHGMEQLLRGIEQLLRHKIQRLRDDE